jgi:hypothetical protein
MKTSKLSTALCFLTSGVLASVPLATASTASGQTPDVVIKAHYSQISKLILKKDAAKLSKAFLSFAAPDFLYLGAAGEKLDAQGFVQNLAGGLSQFQKVSTASMKLSPIKISGQTATLTSSMHVVMITAPMKGKSHKLEATDLSTDVWRKVGTTWKIWRVTVQKSVAEFDGKKMNLRPPQ